MHKFLKKLSLFLATFLLLAALFFLILTPLFPIDLGSFPVLTERLNKLKSRDTSRPTIALIGGSNLYYGIEDSLLQNASSNQIQIINLGFHAGIGLGTMLEDYTTTLKPGDIICLAPEYDHWFSESWSGGVGALSYNLDYRHVPIYHLAFRKYSSIPRRGWSSYFKAKVLTLLGKKDYAGMGVKDLNKVPSTYQPHYASRPIKKAAALIPNETAFAYFEKFLADMNKRGIKVILSAPAYDARHYALHREEIAALYQRIQSLGVKQISNPDDYAFPLEQMYDTEYHLNALGRTNRTLRLIHDLHQNL